MTISSFAARFMGALLLLAAMAACRQNRTVKLAWDAPAVPPTGYRILVDESLAMDIPPPPVDPSCKCMSVNLSVQRGPHTVKVVAYSPAGLSPPSIISVVK